MVYKQFLPSKIKTALPFTAFKIVVFRATHNLLILFDNYPFIAELKLNEVWRAKDAQARLRLAK